MSDTFCALACIARRRACQRRTPRCDMYPTTSSLPNPNLLIQYRVAQVSRCCCHPQQKESKDTLRQRVCMPRAMGLNARLHLTHVRMQNNHNRCQRCQPKRDDAGDQRATILFAPFGHTHTSLASVSESTFAPHVGSVQIQQIFSSAVALSVPARAGKQRSGPEL